MLLRPTLRHQKLLRSELQWPERLRASLPSELSDAFEAWRRVQIQQVFRLSLEALLYWLILELNGDSKHTDVLVHRFLDQATTRPERDTTRQWLDASSLANIAPTAFMDRIEKALQAVADDDLASSIADALAFCLKEAPEEGQPFERMDRLPLFRARREADAWGEAPTRAFVRHVLESWVLAQHVYWSVGRGLADARARGKTILRLKVVLEEGGWTLTPGASGSSRPALPPIGYKLPSAWLRNLVCSMTFLSARRRRGQPASRRVVSNNRHRGLSAASVAD